MRYLAILILAACGDNIGAVDGADAGSGAPLPDAPGTMPGAVERLDWRTTRGAPIATSAIAIPTAEMFALSGDGFVTRSDCQTPPGCTLTWRDLAGAPTLRRDHMSQLTTTSVSPDGKRALLAAVDEIEACNDGQNQFSVARGVLQLLDVATGAASFELPLRSNFWSPPAFMPQSDWFFAAPIEGTACIAQTLGHRSVAPPHTPPPGLDATDLLVQMVDANRYVVARNTDLGIADPLQPGSFRFLGQEPSRFDVTRGWVHVYLGFGLLAQDVVSVPPSGPTRTITLRDEDWLPFGSSGRWIRVCDNRLREGFRDCRVVDALAELAPVNFRATFAVDHRDDAVLLADGAVVFIGPTDDGTRAVQRIGFATGKHEILHVGDGKLRPLGDGAAALLIQDGAAWLIEAEREELVAEHVANVLTAPQIPVLLRNPGRHDDLAVLVSSSSTDQFTLSILDVRTRRLALVTDSLYFAPPVDAPFPLDDGCGQPWTTRNGGGIVDGLFQQPRHLFFVEQGPTATLWLLPVDLSEPPRRFAELASPKTCRAPLTSPDGRRVGFGEDGTEGTTQITLSSEP